MSERPTAEVLGLLLELCVVDKAAHALRRQLGLYPGMLAQLDAREEAAARKEADLARRHAEARELRRKADLEVKALRERIGKYQLQQNQVKTNKEYEAITHEIQGVKAKIDEVETGGLEALEAEERLEREKSEAAAAAKKQKAEHATERERIARQGDEKRGRLGELEAERAGRFGALPADLQEPYDLIDGAHPGEALAKLAGGSCSGCGYTFPKHLVHAIRGGEQLVRCANCSRIVYEPEG